MKNIQSFILTNNIWMNRNVQIKFGSLNKKYKIPFERQPTLYGSLIVIILF